MLVPNQQERDERDPNVTRWYGPAPDPPDPPDPPEPNDVALARDRLARWDDPDERSRRGFAAVSQLGQDAFSSLRAMLERLEQIAEIIELGDSRVLAGDGPVAGLPPAINMGEWRRMYCLATGKDEPPELPPPESLTPEQLAAISDDTLLREHQRRFAEFQVKEPAPASASRLNLDISDSERARVLHRVVRAMHDGHCPACGWRDKAEEFRDETHPMGQRPVVDYACPVCQARVTSDEATAALAEFQPFMQRNWMIFHEWSKQRQEASRGQSL